KRESGVSALRSGLADGAGTGSGNGVGSGSFARPGVVKASAAKRTVARASGERDMQHSPVRRAGGFRDVVRRVSSAGQNFTPAPSAILRMRSRAILAAESGFS